MGVFDFPLSKLKTYEGINPKPDDFEAYWDRGLQEMEALDPQVELTPAGFRHPTLDCFDLTFTGTHGARPRQICPPQEICGPSACRDALSRVFRPCR